MQPLIHLNNASVPAQRPLAKKMGVKQLKASICAITLSIIWYHNQSSTYSRKITYDIRLLVFLLIVVVKDKIMVTVVVKSE